MTNSGKISGYATQGAAHTKAQFCLEPLWDCNEAAEFLRLHPKTVKRMVRAGELPGCQVGKRWCFRPSDLDKWLRAKISSPSQGQDPPQLRRT